MYCVSLTDTTSSTTGVIAIVETAVFQRKAHAHAYAFTLCAAVYSILYSRYITTTIAVNYISLRIDYGTGKSRNSNSNQRKQLHIHTLLRHYFVLNSACAQTENLLCCIVIVIVLCGPLAHAKRGRTEAR
jgi:hypothetical protein